MKSRLWIVVFAILLGISTNCVANEMPNEALMNELFDLMQSNTATECKSKKPGRDLLAEYQQPYCDCYARRMRSFMFSDFYEVSVRQECMQASYWADVFKNSENFRPMAKQLYSELGILKFEVFALCFGAVIKRVGFENVQMGEGKVQFNECLRMVGKDEE